MAETPIDPPTASLTESMKSAQREALSTIAGSLRELRARFDGTAEDSYATRLELRSNINDLADAANAIRRPSGGHINLGRQVTDYGHDPEAEAADRSSGIEHVSAADQARQRHGLLIQQLAPTIDGLRAAGFTVATQLTFVEPPEPAAYHELEGMEAQTSATREALKLIERSVVNLPSADAKFGEALQNLVRQGSDPDLQSQPAFQHKVAYALQDLEKVAPTTGTLPPEARSEMTRLAASAPGLENERMAALMASTDSISGNRGLIREIRITGADIGLRMDQDTPDIQSRIDALENKVRLAPQPSGSTNGAGTDTSGGPVGGAETAAGRPRGSESDPVQEVLRRMERMYPIVLSSNEPKLAETLDHVIRRGKDPAQAAQPDFPHHVAYALQDLERSRGPVSLSTTASNEMALLAVTAPGLENERLLALMRNTGFIGSQSVVNEIRKLAVHTGRQTDQDTPAIQKNVEGLEAKVSPARAGAMAPSSDALGSDQTSTGERLGPDGSTNQARQRAGQHGCNQPPQIYYPRSVLDTLLSGMRAQVPGSGAPGEPSHTPMAERLAAFERKTQDERDEKALAGTIKSGRAAIDALQAFNNGEGAAVMSRIREAAKSDPGGLPGVLSEMREGGRFSDLRGQFNNALETDRGLAAAYDRAADTLARYGKDRSAAQDILSRRNDTGATVARFEKMDAEIGEAAASTPSRNDGRSMFDDLAKKAAEIVQRAIDAVKSAFTGSPTATSQPAPSPSMSMG